MNPWDIGIGILLILVIAGAVYGTIKRRKKGGCCGDCSQCHGCQKK